MWRRAHEDVEDGSDRLHPLGELAHDTPDAHQLRDLQKLQRRERAVTRAALARSDVRIRQLDEGGDRVAGEGSDRVDDEPRRQVEPPILGRVEHERAIRRVVACAEGE